MTTTVEFSRVADYRGDLKCLESYIAGAIDFHEDIPTITYQMLSKHLPSISYLIRDNFEGNIEKMLGSLDTGAFYWDGNLIAPQKYKTPLFELAEWFISEGERELYDACTNPNNPHHELTIRLWGNDHYYDGDDPFHFWDRSIDSEQAHIFWNRFLFSSTQTWNGENILKVLSQLHKLYSGSWPTIEEFERNQKFYISNGRTKDNAKGVYQRIRKLERGRVRAGQYLRPVHGFFRKLYGTSPRKY